ncbi:hypothetical protein ACROYT_G004736 [Oculina patagonica]
MVMQSQRRGSGLYWIDPNGGSTDDSFQAFCDMETERGGWTLVATKVSPSFPFFKPRFSTLAAKTKNADAASHIHPDMGDWEEVMFRFADVNNIRVIYNRKAGAPQIGKTQFEMFLMGKSLHPKSKDVYGFYKYSPADHNKRNPAVSFATISRLALDSDYGISEWHYGTDKWIDMWTGLDDRPNYGQKGERGLPGKPQHGAIKFSDTAENCSLHTAGTVRYNSSQNALQLCDGSAWLPLVTAGKGLQGKDGRDGRNGKNGLKGKKGEPGSSSNPSHGAIKFSYTADTCSLHTAGTVRYSSSQNALQLCDGSAWLSVLTAGKGQSRGSGFYWIDPNGGSTDDSFQAFCDMETERGGWTLVATKVSSRFIFIKTSFSTVAAKTKYADAASHIHPDMEDWKEVMFRFADVNTIRVIYNRKAGAPQNNKEEFEKLLMGKSASMDKNVFGFYKYSPADHNKRTPAVGFATISLLAVYLKYGISENHGGTDKWLDMWSGADSTNNYVTSDDSRARGTKCIAGYCYLNKPIWVMVR